MRRRETKLPQGGDVFFDFIGLQLVCRLCMCVIHTYIHTYNTLKQFIMPESSILFKLLLVLHQHDQSTNQSTNQSTMEISLCSNL